MRSKDKGGRLVAWTARSSSWRRDSEAWEAAVAELKGKRLNAPDGEADDGALGARVPGAAAGADGAPVDTGRCRTARWRRAPLPTPATTRQPVPAGLPRLLCRKRRAG